MIKGLEQLNKRASRLAGRVNNLRPALREIGVLQTSSFQRQFFSGGIPKWPPSQRALKQGGQTLLDTGRLMRSYMSFDVADRSITWGSNLPYAAIHFFGGVIHRAARSEIFKRLRITRGERKGRFKKGKEAGRGLTFGSYTITIDPRPLRFLPETISDAERILADHALS